MTGVQTWLFRSAVRKLIEEKYGAAGIAMLDAMFKSVEEENARF